MLPEVSRRRQLAPDLEERCELDGGGLADGAAEQRSLGLRAEAIAVLDDIAGELPRPRTREGTLLRLRVELVQQVRLVGHEEQHLGGDAVGRTPGEPVLGVDPDLQVDEARCQRSRHAVHDAAVGLAVAAGNQRGALGELVLADLPVEDELVQRRLDHGYGGRKLLEVDEPAAGVVPRCRRKGGVLLRRARQERRSTVEAVCAWAIACGRCAGSRRSFWARAALSSPALPIWAAFAGFRMSMPATYGHSGPRTRGEWSPSYCGNATGHSS